MYNPRGNKSGRGGTVEQLRLCRPFRSPKTTTTDTHSPNHPPTQSLLHASRHFLFATKVNCFITVPSSRGVDFDGLQKNSTSSIHKK